MKKVSVVPVKEESIGIVPGVHFIVTEPTGKAIVIEFLKGTMTIFEAHLGIITNSLSYDQSSFIANCGLYTGIVRWL